MQLKVLFVDDDRYLGRVVHRILTSWGHLVDVAADGPSALAAIRGAAYDLAIIDFTLGPEDSGVAIVQVLNREAPETVAVLTTTLGSEHLTLPLIRGLRVRELSGPYSQADLRTLIDAVAAQHVKTDPGGE